jgi:lysyl-tRNA synthetase class 2
MMKPSAHIQTLPSPPAPTGPTRTTGPVGTGGHDVTDRRRHDEGPRPVPEPGQSMSSASSALGRTPLSERRSPPTRTPRVEAPAGRRPAGRDPVRRVKAVSALTALGGVFAILAALPPLSARMTGIDRIVNPTTWVGTQVLARVVSLLVGIGLLYLAGNLAREKKSAWAVATVLFATTGVVHLARAPRGGFLHPWAGALQIVFPVFMLGLLFMSRRSFRAEADPPSLFQFLRFGALYGATVFAYGYGALTMEASRLEPAPTFANNVLTIVEELVGIDGEYRYRGAYFSRVFPPSMTILGLSGLAIALYLVFRPILARPRSPEDWDRANRLVHLYGSDTLAYFALRHDKSYFFASDGEAMIAYTYLGRYALASGDPIGRPESIDLVIDEFRAMCRRYGWGTAFLAVRESEAARYTERGLHTFYLGEEAVIDCTEFKLEGKRNKSMRQSVQRVARTYRCEMIAEADAGPELVAQLNTISRKWRGKAPERGFTMALSQAVGDTNPDYRLFVAFDEQGRPGGFLRLVPVFGAEPGMTLDMMRRDPDSPNGMTEFLVANAVFKLRDLGIARLSMNFAVMGRLFSRDVAFTRRQRMLKAVVSLGNPFFQIKSLHDFNRRFRPTGQPRVIAYEDQRALPRVAILYGGVEGFLGLPVIGRYFVPRRFDHDGGRDTRRPSSSR